VKISITLFILFIVFQLSQQSFGQEKPFTLFTEDDGLPDNDVRDMIKDNSGYLWIATSNGLSKYDGQKFTNFQTQQGLPGKWVWSVEKDDQNRIYAGCFRGGLAIIENDKIVKTLYLGKYAQNTIRKLYYSHTHQIMFVGTDFGIYALKDTTFTLLSYPNDAPEKSSILAIVEYGGDIYFTVHNTMAHGGFFRMEINDQDLKKTKVTKIVGGGQGFGITVIKDTIYFNVNSDIYKYDQNSHKAGSFFKTPYQFNIWTLGSIGYDKIALGGYGENRFHSGLRIFDCKKKRTIESPYRFDGATINNIVHDKNSNSTWICSEIGLAYINNSSPFEFYETDDKSIIKDIEVLNDSIFVLTEKDLWILRNSEVKKYLGYPELNQIANQKMNEFFRNATLKKKAINKDWKLLIMNKNETVIPLNFAKEDGELFLTTSLGTISIPGMRTYLPVIDGQFIKKDNFGRSFWMPGYDFLRFSDHDHDPFYNNYFEPENKYRVKSIFKVLKGGNALFFASVFDGIFAIKGNEIFNLNSKNSEIGDNISDIEQDHEGKIWCATSNGNLLKLELNDSLYVAKKFNAQNCKIIGNNYKWLKFNKENLFVGTNKGLNKIAIDQLKKDRFDSVLFYNQFNGYSFISTESPVCDEHGNIYVHSANKIIKIKNENPVQVKLKLDFPEIKIDDQSISFDDFTHISLNSSTNNIRIIFSVFKMPSSKNIEYRYSVNEGVRESGNSILLQSLKPGKYSVNCEAKDKETGKQYQEVIQFQIDKPYWQSLWFVVLSAMITGVIIYWILYARFQHQKKKDDENARLARQIADLKIQSLQAQMNPHFIFNILNSIQSLILQSKTKDALQYLGSLGSMIRMNLENVSEEYIPIEEEIRFLKKYIEIEELRFKKRFQVELKNDIPEVNILVPPMLIQPIIENAIKHGVRGLNDGGLVTVSFNVENERLSITVEDNGIGRMASNRTKIEHHQSKGQELIERRLNLLNEKNKTTANSISITDLEEKGQPSGTKVIVTLELIWAT